VIQFKPIEAYYTDDDKAIIARKAELAATGKRLQSELAALDAAIAAQSDLPTPEDRIQNLIAGTAPQKPPSAKRTELQIAIRDIEQALDYMAGKERRVTMTAGARLCKDVKPQVDKAEKELAAAMVIAHEKQFMRWQAKQYLVNAGTGLNGLFDSNVEKILGVPVDKGSVLHDYFYAAVKAGHLRAVPAALR
jgi:hypothetical protein